MTKLCTVCGKTSRAPWHHGLTFPAVPGVTIHEFAAPSEPLPEPPPEVSAEEAKILRHMLGAGSHIRKSSWGFRNHFATGPGYPDWQTLERLFVRALVHRQPVNPLSVSSDVVVFQATPLGCDAIGLTPAQKKRALNR